MQSRNVPLFIVIVFDEKRSVFGFSERFQQGPAGQIVQWKSEM